MIALLLAASLLPQGVTGLFHHPQSRVEHHVVRVGAWRVKVTRDLFAGATTCTVRAGDMRMENAGVVFALGDRADAHDAIYRIDDGAPRKAAIDDVAAYKLGVDLGDDDLKTSGGLVAVPVADLVGAARIEVRGAPGERIRRFDVSRLKDAMDAARSAGCPMRAPR